jgi:hypothetical protein
MPYLRIDGLCGVEQAVSKLLARVALGEDTRQAVAGLVTNALTHRPDATTATRAALQKRLDALARQVDNLYSVLDDPDWDRERTKAEMRTVRQQQAATRRELESLGRDDNHADTARELLTEALDLLTRPGDIDDRADDTTRTLLVETIFAKVYLEPTLDGAVTVADAEHEAPFDLLDDLATEHRQASAGESGHLVTPATPHRGTRQTQRRKTPGARLRRTAPPARVSKVLVRPVTWS